jgi:hypothetical protein
MTVIDTPEGIQYFRMLSMAHALAFEINVPGMKMSRVSALKAARADGITKSNRKPQALRDVVAALKQVNPDFEPGDTIQKALDRG